MRILTNTLFILISVTSFAQDKHHVLNGLNGGEFKSKAPQKKTGVGISNSVAFSINHIIRGVVCVGYEHIFNNRFGLKSSLGYCFAYDYSQEYFPFSGDPYKQSGQYGYAQYLQNNDFKLGMNYYMDVTAKLCSNAFESPFSWVPAEYRAYVGFSGRMYRNNYAPYSLQMSSNEVTTIPVMFKGWNVQIGFNGYGDNHIFSEVYFGLGNLYISYPGYEQNGSGNHLYYEQNNTQHIQHLLIVVGSTFGLYF